MHRVGVLFGVLGGIVAVAASVSGFLAIGDDPLYQPRVGFGMAALLLGIIASIGGLVPTLHPGVAGVLMVVAGSLGLGATLAWYINTFYVAALPLWFIGAALLLLTAALSTRPGRRNGGVAGGKRGTLRGSRSS